MHPASSAGAPFPANQVHSRPAPARTSKGGAPRSRRDITPRPTLPRESPQCAARVPGWRGAPVSFPPPNPPPPPPPPPPPLPPPPSAKPLRRTSANMAPSPSGARGGSSNPGGRSAAVPRARPRPSSAQPTDRSTIPGAASSKVPGEPVRRPQRERGRLRRRNGSRSSHLRSPSTRHDPRFRYGRLRVRVVESMQVTCRTPGW